MAMFSKHIQITLLILGLLALSHPIAWAENCPDLPSEGSGDSGSNTTQSCDPNEKAGTAGAGDALTQRFVLPGSELTYIIYFENKSDAAASAQEVRVTDNLGSQLDWSTFKLGEIVFANQSVTELASQQSGSAEVDQTSSSLRVRIEAGLDTATGTAHWYLRSVDPATQNSWPADPYAGLLPPNDATHRGEGHLVFTIRAKANLATGSRITNTSSIVFDTNAVIDTNEVFNTIVADPPAAPSGPTPLAGGKANPGTISLSWNAALLAQSYDVYIWPADQIKPSAPSAISLASAFFVSSLKGKVDDAYLWQVVARNTYGSTPGPVWSFTVASPSATVIIHPNITSATWTLQPNCSCGSRSGTGPATLTDIPAGPLTLTWGTLANFASPSPNPLARTVYANTTVTLTGSYARLTGTVSVDVTPNDVPWSFSDSGETTHAGTGDARGISAYAGPLTMAWGSLAGYDAPAPSTETQTLNSGGMVQFKNIYVPSAAGDARTEALLLRYLLGLSNASAGLDLNNDGTVTIADLVYLVTHLAPDLPGGPSPVDGAWGVSIDTKLDWSNATRAQSYDLYLWKMGANQPLTPTTSSLPISQWMPGAPLDYSTTYNWRVVARNSDKVTTGPMWTLTTTTNTIQLLAPNGGETWKIGQPGQLTVKAQTGVAGTAFRCELWRNGATVAKLCDSFIGSDDGGSTMTTFVVPAVESGAYTVRATSYWLEEHGQPRPWDESDGAIMVNQP
jgi:hypothetical protein